MKHLLVVAAALVAFAGGYALADVPLGTALTGQAVIERGNYWLRLPDAGFRYEVCGYSLRADGVKVTHFPPIDGGTEPTGPCEPCEPGPWSAAPAFCTAQWKANRGL